MSETLSLIDEILDNVNKAAKMTMISKEKACKGRDKMLFKLNNHDVIGNSLLPPFPNDMEIAIFGMGCFWSAEKVFYDLTDNENNGGIYSTHVGFAGGYTKYPTNDEVNANITGHAEVVRIVYNPKYVSYNDLLKLFWNNHNSTQYMAQGIYYGTQYRSVIICDNEIQKQIALKSKQEQQILIGSDKCITTEIMVKCPFYYAESRHQQYFSKNPTECPCYTK
eukprot:102032_1